MGRNNAALEPFSVETVVPSQTRPQQMEVTEMTIKIDKEDARQGDEHMENTSALIWGLACTVMGFGLIASAIAMQ